MMNVEDNFKHYVHYLGAKFKRKIKEAQNSKNHSSRPEDSAYKMGYLMALYHVIDEMEMSAGDFDIEKKDIGLQYEVTEISINFLLNLSYISEKLYQKRIKFKEGQDCEGEFNHLNNYILDQCEAMLVLAKFKEKCEASLIKFYGHFEPFYQNYDGLYNSQRKHSWKELVKIAKEILNAFEFHKNPQLLKGQLAVKLSKNEYDYLSQALFLPKSFKKWYFSDKQIKDSYCREIPVSHADEIKSLCQTQLQAVHSAEGKILEILIAKFFVGFFNGV